MFAVQTGDDRVHRGTIKKCGRGKETGIKEGTL